MGYLVIAVALAALLAFSALFLFRKNECLWGRFGYFLLCLASGLGSGILYASTGWMVAPLLGLLFVSLPSSILLTVYSVFALKGGVLGGIHSFLFSPFIQLLMLPINMTMTENSPEAFALGIVFLIIDCVLLAFFLLFTRKKILEKA